MWVKMCVLLGVVTTCASNPLERIAGGHRTSIEVHTYMLQLMLPNGKQCGATAIGRKWAITAAHCTDGCVGNNFTVRVGSSIRNEGGFVIPIARVIQHEAYNMDMLGIPHNDISLLNAGISFYNLPGFAVFPARLPTRGYDYIPPGTLVTTVGWGLTEGDENSRWLMELDIPVFLFQSLFGEDALPTFFYKYDGKVQAQEGDSGGPGLIGAVLVGVTSYKFETSALGSFTVFARVSHFVPWILDSIGGDIWELG